MEFLQGPVMTASCSLFSVFVSPTERRNLENFIGPWCTIAVALQTIKKKMNETSDDARWVLTINRVSPKCRDIASPARLCCGTWLMRMFTKTKKWVRKKGTRYESSLAALCSTRGLHCAVGFLRLFHRSTKAMNFLHSRGCAGSPSWLPNHAGRTNVDDEWA
jgi:hypothetical protein